MLVVTFLFTFRHLEKKVPDPHLRYGPNCVMRTVIRLTASQQCAACNACEEVICFFFFLKCTVNSIGYILNGATNKFLCPSRNQNIIVPPSKCRNVPNSVIFHLSPSHLLSSPGYSRVRNKHAGMLIYSASKNPVRHAYSGRHTANDTLPMTRLCRLHTSNVCSVNPQLVPVHQSFTQKEDIIKPLEDYDCY